MADKFIPDSDSDFAMMARLFARNIARDPGRFRISQSDADEITHVVNEFREALAVATQPGTRTKLTIMSKDEARKRAVRIVRRFGNLIRANDEISKIDKMVIFVKERAERLHKRACPQTAPWLRFVGSSPETGAPGRHILKYYDGFGPGCRAKPEGAARIELFVDLVGPHEPVPEHPGTWAWYVRSFTKNPIEVEHPQPRKPMLVIYWARWADATGEVGPWSKTLVTRIEGWSGHRLAMPGARESQRIQIEVMRRESGKLPERYLEHVSHVVPELPAPSKATPLLGNEAA